MERPSLLETFPYIPIRMQGIGSDDTPRMVRYTAIDGYAFVGGYTRVYFHNEWHRTANTIEEIASMLRECEEIAHPSPNSTKEESNVDARSDTYPDPMGRRGKK